MSFGPPFNNRNLLIGLILTCATALNLVVDSFIIGRNAFFMVLNIDLGIVADYFFRFWTNLGDGIIWVIITFLFFRYQKNKLPLLIAAILISTLITQVTKTYIVPAEPRPTAAIANTNSIHTVPGVELLTAYSFPSGHTATAFTIFLLGCFLIKGRWIIPVGFVYSMLVGYSRIYLAEHFPLDVGAGMFTAVITILISIIIQEHWEKRSTL